MNDDLIARGIDKSESAERDLPVFGGGSSVSLASVLEPVADLGRRESGGLGELALLGRIGVRVLQVPLAEQRASALLEAVRLLLAVPDGARERELFADAVLVDGPERPAAQLLRLHVVRLEPHGLQLAVRLLGEAVRLDDVVQLAVVAHVVGDERPGPEHGLVLVQLADVRVGDGQRPQEAAEALDVAALLERLANGRHLAHGEVERRQGRRRRDRARARRRRAAAREQRRRHERERGRLVRRGGRAPAQRRNGSRTGRQSHFSHSERKMSNTHVGHRPHRDRERATGWQTRPREKHRALGSQVWMARPSGCK